MLPRISQFNWSTAASLLGAARAAVEGTCGVLFLVLSVGALGLGFGSWGVGLRFEILGSGFWVEGQGLGSRVSGLPHRRGA